METKQKRVRKGATQVINTEKDIKSVDLTNNRRGLRWKKTGLFLGLGFVALVTTVFLTDKFFDNYDLNFQSPIVIQAPIQMVARSHGNGLISPVAAYAGESTKSGDLKGQALVTQEQK